MVVHKQRNQLKRQRILNHKHQEQINNTRISNTNPKDTNGKTSMAGIEGAKKVVGKYSVIRRGIGIAFDSMTLGS